MPKRSPLDETATRELIKRHEQGASQQQLSEEFGCSITFIRKMLKLQECKPHRSGVRRTIRPDLDTAKMVAMRDEGLSYREISRRLRCDASGVRRRILGI